MEQTEKNIQRLTQVQSDTVSKADGVRIKVLKHHYLTLNIRIAIDINRFRN